MLGKILIQHAVQENIICAIQSAAVCYCYLVGIHISYLWNRRQITSLSAFTLNDCLFSTFVVESISTYWASFLVWIAIIPQDLWKMQIGQYILGVYKIWWQHKYTFICCCATLLHILQFIYLLEYTMHSLYNVNLQ